MPPPSGGLRLLKNEPFPVPKSKDRDGVRRPCKRHIGDTHQNDCKMTEPIDQNLKRAGLTHNASTMLDLRSKVLSEWERRVRAEIRPAAGLPHPIIIDTFPGLYDSLIEAIAPNYPRTSAIATTTIASEHGAERARLTGYDSQSVITEYELMQSTIVDVLASDGIRLADQEADIVNMSLDAAIRESVTAFALAQSVLRERSVAGLIHDLRHPLSTARVAAGILTSLVDTAQARELTEVLAENLDRSERLVQDMLGQLVFHTGERLRLHLTNWDVLRLAHEVAHAYGQARGARFEVEGRNVKGYWDRSCMRRALENMLDNALRYSLPDGPIRVHVDALHERMILTVHNEGAAIPPDRLESVFQVYRRALAGRRPETDLSAADVGMPYVRSVAGSHGGSVGIESLTGRGTTCIIDMPIDSRPFRNAPTVGTDRY